jgi:hypothetical protein
MIPISLRVIITKGHRTVALGSAKMKRWLLRAALTLSGSLVVPLVFAVTATAYQSSPVRPSIDPGVAQAGRLIAAIIDDRASINQEAPHCINHELFGQLIMITSTRPGFPLDAVTFAKIQNGNPVTVSYITARAADVGRGDVIERVAQFLNDRARERARAFAALCSASRSVERLLRGLLTTI